MDIPETVFLIGLILLGVGCWLIYAPLGLIVPGGALCLVGLALARGESRSNEVHDDE